MPVLKVLTIMFQAMLATAAVVVLCATSIGAGGAQAELFTAEGCSSCPPADRLLETLLEEQPISGVHVIALSQHVTYWDHQRWKDPFGSEQFTNRQKAYGLAFSLDSIYTPQLVIDCVSEAVGSDERNIRRFVNACGEDAEAAADGRSVDQRRCDIDDRLGPGTGGGG